MCTPTCTRPVDDPAVKNEMDGAETGTETKNRGGGGGGGRSRGRAEAEALCVRCVSSRSK